MSRKVVDCHHGMMFPRQQIYPAQCHPKMSIKTGCCLWKRDLIQDILKLQIILTAIGTSKQWPFDKLCMIPNESCFFIHRDTYSDRSGSSSPDSEIADFKLCSIAQE